VIDGQVAQVVHEEVPFEIEILSADDFTDLTDDSLIAQLVNSFVRPFDLAQAPLVRIGLLKKSETEQLIVLDTHHIIADAASNGIIKTELLAIYSGQQLKPLNIQYKDYCQWHFQDNRDMQENQKAFWLDLLKGELPILNVATDFPRTANLTQSAGTKLVFSLDKEKTEQLRQLARDREATMFMVLFATYFVFLSKFAQQDDIIVGTPSFGRRHADLERVVGMFVNMLAIRSRPLKELSFTDYLQNLKELMLHAYENQDYYFGDIVAELELFREGRRNPIFDTGFSYKAPDPAAKAGFEGNVPGTDEEASARNIDYQDETIKFDFAFEVLDKIDSLSFRFEFDTGLYKKESMNKLLGYYKQTIDTITADPTQKIADIELISESEKEEMLETLKKNLGVAANTATNIEKTASDDTQGDDSLVADFDF
jgi:hypothetical protein